MRKFRRVEISPPYLDPYLIHVPARAEKFELKAMRLQIPCAASEVTTTNPSYGAHANRITMARADDSDAGGNHGAK